MFGIAGILIGMVRSFHITVYRFVGLLMGILPTNHVLCMFEEKIFDWRKAYNF